MNRYWDKTEQEKATMTREQVQAYLDVELMEKGVVKVERPILQDLEPVEVPVTRMYEVQKKGSYSSEGTGWCFETMEEAQAFINARPFHYERDWQTDCHYAKPAQEMMIGPIDVPNEADWAMQKARLEKNKAAKQANETVLKDYNKSIEEIQKATSGVWDDWRTCREKATRAQKVIDTRAEYVKLCNGDEAVAKTFLAKAFKEEEIAAADAWNTA